VVGDVDLLHTSRASCRNLKKCQPPVNLSPIIQHMSCDTIDAPCSPANWAIVFRAGTVTTFGLLSSYPTFTCAPILLTIADIDTRLLLGSWMQCLQYEYKELDAQYTIR
jgi:hypothetical protein